MISDEEIEEAINYLADTAELAAQAKANKGYLVEYRKVKKAELMGLSNEEAVNAQERFAYSHHEYKEFLLGLKEAIRQDARHEFMRETYIKKIDAWQTQSANYRGMEKVR